MRHLTGILALDWHVFIGLFVLSPNLLACCPKSNHPDPSNDYVTLLFRHLWRHHTIYRKIWIGIWHSSPFPGRQPSFYFQSHLYALWFSRGNNLLFIIPLTFHLLCGGGWSSHTRSTCSNPVSSIPPSLGNDLWSSFWISQGNWYFSCDIFFTIYYFIHIFTSFLLNFTALSLNAWH